VLVLAWTAYAFNRLVKYRLRTDEAWSTVDVQIKRRSSLIPNVVETVSGYATHERSTLENVIRARQQVDQAKGAANVSTADTLLAGALKQLLAVVEAYPDLKASSHFMELQKDLSDLEEKIAFARQFYNRAVLDYNTLVGTVPSSIVAAALDFSPREFFETESRDAPQVHFRAPGESSGPRPSTT
jgi:LemA protein